MSTTEIVEKFTTVEAALAEFIMQANHSFNYPSQEVRPLKDEMRDFKKEMHEFKEESRRTTREMNKQWGNLADKMGTLAKDIIAPTISSVMEPFFKEEITFRAEDVYKQNRARDLHGEFDVIAASKSYVFLVETKSRPQKPDIQEFTENKIPRFRELFPEFASLELVPVFASLRFENEFLDWATEAGVYLMAYREWDYMDILNFEALHPISPA